MQVITLNLLSCHQQQPKLIIKFNKYNAKIKKPMHHHISPNYLDYKEIDCLYHQMSSNWANKSLMQHIDQVRCSG